QGMLVPFGSAGVGTAVLSTAPSAAARGSLAGCPLPRLRPAARGRVGTVDVVAHGMVPPFSHTPPAALGPPVLISPATTAWPPSVTCTCWTTTTCLPPVRSLA